MYRRETQGTQAAKAGRWHLSKGLVPRFGGKVRAHDQVHATRVDLESIGIRSNDDFLPAI